MQGGATALPKQILNRMPKANGLTREIVASHLQKYRQNLKKSGVHHPNSEVALKNMEIQNKGIQYTEACASMGIRLSSGENLVFKS